MLSAEHVDPLVTVLLLEAEEALRQSGRFAIMYEALPANEPIEVLAYVRKMRVHWEARHGAYMALADSLAGRRYALSHIRRAEAQALLNQAERALIKGNDNGEEGTEQGSEGAPKGDR